MILGDRLKIRAEACAWPEPIKLDAGPQQRNEKKRKTREEEEEGRRMARGERTRRREGKGGSVKKSNKRHCLVVRFW